MSTSATKSPETADSTPRPVKKKPPGQEGTWRETIEQIAIAFIMAFLFKTFQFEAYIIPTGSMGPTLWGRQKEVTCSGCDFQYALGASREVNGDSTTVYDRIRDSVCPSCGHVSNVKSVAANNGDRIAVNKQHRDYKRFEVVVFKNPEKGQVNYIKRLIGLPGETIRVRKGDIWAKMGDGPFQIQRKEDLEVQRAIQLTVNDDNFPPGDLLLAGWPERWQPAKPNLFSAANGRWETVENAISPDRAERQYAITANPEDQWLRYINYVAEDSDWQNAMAGQPLSARPKLVSDFCSFNSVESSRYGFDSGAYWVGDLTVSGRIQVTKADASSVITLELVEGVDTFQCVISADSGDVELRRMESEGRGNVQVAGRGSCSLKGAGDYQVAFANVDDRLCLWVDDELVEFDTGGIYESTDEVWPGDADLAPAGIAFRQIEGTLSDLLVQRDIYYRNEVVALNDGCVGSSDMSPRIPYEFGIPMYDEANGSLHHLLTDPATYRAQYERGMATFRNEYLKFGDYQLGEGEYLMFGDNSSASKDSRLFDYELRPMIGIASKRYVVREKDLIGKALYIWWPHGVPFLNGGKGYALRTHYDANGNKLKDYPHPSLRVPFYPNFWRMGKIR